MDTIVRLKELLTTGIWSVRLGELKGARGLGLRTLRVAATAAKGFVEDRCSLRASALTFYSLLAIVPVLAMAFGVAKGFGLRQLLRRRLLEAFSGQEEVLTTAIDFADRLLESASGGTVAGIGVAVLFWSVIKVLGHIEGSFNVIWEVKEQRPLGRRISNYLAIMIISPVALIVSGSLTVFISTQLTSVVERVGLMGFFAPAVFLALKLLPYVLMWLLLAFVYITVPNTRVRFVPGLVGAVVAGTSYQLVQWFYITFQVGISKYNAVYGSFAALPLFLFWLNLSWFIILFGAELSYAADNAEEYDLAPEAEGASLSARKLASLFIALHVVKAFARDEGPVAAGEIPARTGLPPRLVRELLTGLVEAGVLSECGDKYARKLDYQPAIPVDHISIGSVLDALERSRGVDLSTPGSEEERELAAALATLRTEALASPANRLLRDI